MKNLFLIIAFLFLGFGSIAQTTWKTDPYHSSVNFKIKHSGISLIPGHFDKFSGTMIYDKPDFTDAKISFTVDVNSINTSVTPRDNHLRSADFFDVAKYPEMKFESTKFVKKKKKGNKYLLYGNLTIKDVTKPVVFNVEYGGEKTDDKGNVKHGFEASYTLNRMDYNVNYDPTGLGIAKDVKIKLYLQFNKEK